ncbi:adenosylcobinamide-GDP ribazoletransferase [Clostridium tetani]|uniref:Adenosylcobinamide-GDP ribazoletransferase n=1 Tax=Clostridium tetani TaxID=1513 RepID=A0A4Q0UXG8_CLOTA|nr:adenosylcobinamide-GDP ribazoletransferase [Clostridium tetani]CDI48775.1 cobalamin synthase [Clostridium tetani 12124569]KHO39856.1 cobalamin synthase [Clostridium tetani]RXI38350.1 adenosylcobinamide-GDP ribazoletransferase [Clostridium tetani]RXI46115.1 adenosylcobinamide-GDP ribazoletransferase [Clostridium tetani]RXI54543.1 adenosylcobinamide-GDP ribazoletransferase [Clostridium tetani]
MKYIYNFLLMIQFLTRIPVKRSLPCEKEDFRRGAAMLPIIGLIVGCIQWTVFYILSKIFPANITAIFIILVGMVLIGGLHQDGLGDIFDGFFSFKGDKEKIIEIMKDSRVGTFAVLALIFDILIKYTALSFIIENNMSYAIIITPIMSRCTLVFLFLIGKNAKKNGTGNLFIQNVSVKEFIISFIFMIVPSVLLIGYKYSVIIIVVSFIITLAFLNLCNRKIGGITGDCLGANNEIVEMFTMLVFVALLYIN